MSDSEIIESDQEEESLESRDVESLRELLEAETKAKKGAVDEYSIASSATVQVIDQLQLCLSSNQELQRLLCSYLSGVDAAIRENKKKREELRRNGMRYLKNVCTLRKVRKRKKSYFTDYAGNYPDIPSAFNHPSLVENYYFHDNQWSATEDFTLKKHVMAQAIELAGRPYEVQLQSTTDDKEIKLIREKMKELSYQSFDSSLLLSLDSDKIFWDSIAYEGFRSQRTAYDCHQRWVSNLNPSINTSSWTKEDDRKLMRAGKEMGGRQWEKVAEAVGNGRSSFSCFKRYQSTFSCYNRQSFWPKKMDQDLKEAVTKYGEDNWLLVARSLSRSVSLCRARWLRTLSPNIKKGRWNAEEDKQLIAAVQQSGSTSQYNWMEISYSVPGRNSPQCRERWVNVLDPNLKKNPDFNEAEDMELMEVCQKYHVEGIPIPWSKVARSLPGRTDAKCALRWRQLSSTQTVEEHYKQIKIKEKMKKPYLYMKGLRGKKMSRLHQQLTLDFHEFDEGMLPEELCEEAEIYGKECAIKRMKKIPDSPSPHEDHQQDDGMKEQSLQLQVSLDTIVPALDIGDMLNRQELLNLGAIPLVSTVAAATSPCVTYSSTDDVSFLQDASNSTISTLGDRHFASSLNTAQSKTCPPTLQIKPALQPDFTPDNPFPTGPRVVTAVVNVKMVVSGNDPKPKLVVTPKSRAKKGKRKTCDGQSRKTTKKGQRKGCRLDQASKDSTSTSVDHSAVTRISSRTTLVTQATQTNAATHPMMATTETAIVHATGVNQDKHTMSLSSVTLATESSLVSPAIQSTSDTSNSLTASVDQTVHVPFENNLDEENSRSFVNSTAVIHSGGQNLSILPESFNDTCSLRHTSLRSLEESTISACRSKEISSGSGDIHPSTSLDPASSDSINPEMRGSIDDNTSSQDIVEDCGLSDADVGLSSNVTRISTTRNNSSSSFEGTASKPVTADSTQQQGQPVERVTSVPKASLRPLILSRDCLNQLTNVYLGQTAGLTHVSHSLNKNVNAVQSDTVACTSTDDHVYDVSDEVAKLQYKIWNGDSIGQIQFANMATLCNDPVIWNGELNPSYIPVECTPRACKRQLNTTGRSCSKRMRKSQVSQESELSNQMECRTKETSSSELKEGEKRKTKHKPLLVQAKGCKSTQKRKNSVLTKSDISREETCENREGKRGVHQKQTAIAISNRSVVIIPVNTGDVNRSVPGDKI